MNTLTQPKKRNGKIRQYSRLLLNLVRQGHENKRSPAFLLCWRFLAMKSKIDRYTRATLDETELNQMVVAAEELLSNGKKAGAA